VEVTILQLLNIVQFLSSGKISDMGSNERRARHKEALRERILEAARALIMRDGFASLTMRNIATAIEYSPAAIYLHFRDRDEIAKELSRQGYAQLYEALKPAAAIEDPRERLKEIGRAYVQFGMENPETYRLIFMDYNYLAAVFGGEQQDPGADQADDETGRGAFDLLMDNAAALPLRAPGTPQQIAETLWAGVHGIVSLKLTCPAFPVSTAQQLARIMTQALVDGLTTPPPEPAARLTAGKRSLPAKPRNTRAARSARTVVP
jgi:AcrR family transcriptional regulator